MERTDDCDDPGMSPPRPDRRGRPARQPQVTEPYRTDFWLWLVLFSLAFLALGSVRWPPAANAHSLWENTRLVAQGRWSASDGSLVFVQALVAASLALIAGWGGQALAQSCGLRRSRLPSRATAADNDDGAPPGRRPVPAGRPRPTRRRA